MEEKNYTGLIPPNEKGKIIECDASVKLKNADEARSFFQTAKERLLRVNNWKNIADKLGATFKLVDENGNEVARNAKKGDYFKIDVPGPGSEAGQGYDWVQIEDMKEFTQDDVESFGFRVRPASNPFSKDDSIAHFYSEDSTSTFLVTREGEKITASIYDRNTKPNKDAETVVDKIRHIAVGLGAISAFSKIQWQDLADGLVKIDQAGKQV